MLNIMYAMLLQEQLFWKRDWNYFGFIQYRTRRHMIWIFSLICYVTERTNRKRRQSGMNKLCTGGMDLATAYQYCSSPDLRCRVLTRNCYKYVICKVGYGPGQQPPPHVQKVFFNSNGNLCWQEHIWSAITCCEYICKTFAIISNKATTFIWINLK